MVYTFLTVSSQDTHHVSQVLIYLDGVGSEGPDV